MNGARGTALHRQIYLVLRDEISRGPVPGRRVAERGSALRAIRRLAHHRAARPGRPGGARAWSSAGTAAAPSCGASPAQLRPVPSLSVIDSLRKTAIETIVRVLEVEQTAPPADVARLLQLPPGEKAVHALRIRSNRNGQPAMLTDAWVPAAVGRRVTAAALKKKALYEILMTQGVEFGRVVQEFSATVSDPDRAGTAADGGGCAAIEAGAADA